MNEQQMHALQQSAEMIVDAIKAHFSQIGHVLPVDMMERVDGGINVLENVLEEVFEQVRSTV